MRVVSPAEALTSCLLVLLLGCATPVRHEGPHPAGGTRSGDLLSGKQEGEWVGRFPNGQVSERGTYKDDERHGVWTFFHPNGQRAMRGAFDKGLRSGAWECWHPNGKLQARGCFHDGVEIGEWCFFDEHGSRSRSGDREGALRVLHWAQFDPRGFVASAGYYSKGAKVGPWVYRNAANKAREVTYATPARLRLVRESWPDGTVRREGFVRDDVRVGRWATRHPNGQRRLTGDFVDGKAQGVWQAYRSDGSLFATGRIDGGRMIGEWRVCAGEGAANAIARDAGKRPPALWSGEWSKADASAEVDPLWVVAGWLAEATSPLDKAAPVVVKSKTKAEPTPRVVPAEQDMPLPPTAATVREIAAQSRYEKRLEKGQAEEAWSYQGMEPEVERGDVRAARRLRGKPFPGGRLVRAEGGNFDLARLRGSTTVLVLLHGFRGRVCNYCVAQVGALGKTAAQFRRKGADVVIVYPGDERRLKAFQKEVAAATKAKRWTLPFPLLYDPDLELVDRLGLRWHRGQLARPTTMVVDPEGRVRFVYVGKPRAHWDRPTVPALLDAVDAVPRL